MIAHCPSPAVPYGEIAFVASLVGLASFMLGAAVAVFVLAGGVDFLWGLINGGGEENAG